MPNNIFYNSILANEILFTTILLIITNIYFSKVKHKYIYIGVLTGVNTIIKPFFILFAFAVFLVNLLKRKKVIKINGKFLNCVSNLHIGNITLDL